jgi:hypothetical protein
MQSILNDLQFCLETLGLNDTQTGEILNCCENLGITCEYFCEEFILGNVENSLELAMEDMDRLHDSNYLNITQFNHLYWSH